MIIATKYDDLYGTVSDREQCNICGDPLWYPFMEWRGEKSIYLCKHCCRAQKRGLVADVVHLAAIAELHAAGYYDQTLTREFSKNVEQRGAEKKRAEEAEMFTAMGKTALGPEAA